MSLSQPTKAATVATAAAAAASPTSISNFDTGLDGVNQVQNMLFKDMLWWSLGIVALLILAMRLLEISWSWLRHVSAMSLPGASQTYWRIAQWSHMPWIKKHLTYAPIWRKRHNREMRISSAIQIGTLPTRLQAVLLSAYLGSNLAYMFILDYGQPNHWALLAELRGRSGTLAAVNLVPLVLLAGRNNPLIGLLRISFDTYNLLHRWMGRTVVVEAVIHTIAWLVVQVNDGGWASVGFKVVHDRFIASGMAGTGAFVLLVVLSVSPLRHAFYETFLASHILLALVIIVCTWVHCATASLAGGLPQLSYVIAVLLLWLAERLARVGLSACRSWSRHGWPDAVVEPMPGDCCRVTVHLPRFADVRPGTHAYLRFSDINPWECHPFSIAWVEHKPINGSGRHGAGDVLPIAEKKQRTAWQPSERQKLFGLASPPLSSTSAAATLNGYQAVKKSDLMRTSVSFVIGAQTGFTRKLYNRACDSGKKAITFKALFEGPYAGHHSLDSYGHVVLVAGATGITHQISYLRHLIEGYADGTVATRRITLVWIVRDYEAFEWVRPWMDEILRLPHRPEILQIRLFVTRPKHPQHGRQGATLSSRTVQMFPGRPNMSVLLKQEVAAQMGAMCVTVCGPGALADDVRSAVREVLDQGTVVDFIEESFTW
ncbi:ferric reductase-like protein [Niveomyces insectorum RCEF 264]|uniref:Ferric reductase-like protein n=1 Tax=Niveomyces insectorum RCEF 264 TaxID=1081102 RepID=A0A167TFI3_9HYPO|nr:ferric reductase-like protein [Niveomyces insectorum RCEF 264]